jgi:antirestriction protein ArdC
MTTTRTDIHATVTAATIARREAETRPWCEQWNAKHTAGRITRPLRHDGTPHRGINVLLHWMTAEARG